MKNRKEEQGIWRIVWSTSGDGTPSGNVIEAVSAVDASYEFAASAQAIAFWRVILRVSQLGQILTRQLL